MPIFEYQNGDAFYQSPQFQGPLPVWLMPNSFGNSIQEVSQNLKLPVELCAQAALSTVSLVCQFFINVQCPSFDPAPPTLFLLSVSNSSGGKSILEQRFLRAVKVFERKHEEEIEVAKTDYRAEMKIWEDDGRQLSKEYREVKQGSVEAVQIRAQRLQHEKERPVEPKKLEFRYAEMSPEGLRDALVANHAAGIFSPDAGPTLLGKTFSHPAMLSGYWSGEDRPVGLAGGNRRPIMPHLTISLMTQEDRFAAYMKTRGSEAFGTGLLARMLVVFPISVDRQGETTEIEDMPEPKLDLFNQRVGDILNQTMPAPHDRLTLKLSDEAKCYWKWFKDSVHNDLICSDFSDDLKSFFRKIGQQATRLAALFHYFDGASGDISPEAMKGAIALCEWYLWEYIRVFKPYAPSQQQKDENAAQKLLQWIKDVHAEPLRYQKLTWGQYSERDCRNYSNVRDPQELANAINMLVCQGHIAVREGPKGGRIIYYPYWTAPAVPSHFDLPYNRQPNATAQYPNMTSSSATPQWAPAPYNEYFNENLQTAPCPTTDSDSTACQENSDLKQQEMRAVKDRLGSQALAAFGDPPDSDRGG